MRSPFGLHSQVTHSITIVSSCVPIIFKSFKLISSFNRIYVIRPTLFYYLFYGTNFLKIGSGGQKKNKNKSMFIPESMKKIKIKVIFIVISFIIFFEELEDS